MRVNSSVNRQPIFQSTAGFTLLETIVVVSMIGILSAIAAPNWFNFINRQRLNTGQGQVYQAMQQARSKAMLQKVTWQVSFREISVNGMTIIQWAVHLPDSASPNQIPTNVIWNNFESNIQVYKAQNDKGSCETTFNKTTSSCPVGPWRVQFNYIGNTTQLGQITLAAKNNSKLKRCIYVSTLIGTLRTGKEHAKTNSEKKYCY